MKTLDELKAFAEGFGHAWRIESDMLFYADEWVTWGGYDINFVGGNYTRFNDNEGDLRVLAYQADWKDTLPSPIHEFTIYPISEMEAGYEKV